MPWHIESDSELCNGFAVIKDEDGELEGCHRSEKQALAQLAALNIAELEDEEEERIASGPRGVIVDIDDTLVFRGGGKNTELIGYLNQLDAEILVVTGRFVGQRDATRALLDRVGLEYDELHMNPGGDTNAVKREIAGKLLARYDVTDAYENNPDTRAIYAALGITTHAPRGNRAIAEEIVAQLRTR